jgi:FkbM family methyltransferase
MRYLNEPLKVTIYYLMIKLLRGKFYADFFWAEHLWKIGRGIAYEQRIYEIYSRIIRKGDTCIDIGAHLGLHLKNFLHLVGKNGKVLAFEPLPFAYKQIKKKYSSPNCLIFNEAISNLEGVTSFVHAQGLAEQSGFKERLYDFPDQAKPKLIKVKVKTLNSYTEKITKLSFIKIDTEGGEMGCLFGGLDILEKFRPIVSIEYGINSYKNYGYSKFTLYNFAFDNKYTLFDLFFNPINTRSKWEKVCNSIYWDFFMVPNEKIKAFKELNV